MRYNQSLTKSGARPLVRCKLKKRGRGGENEYEFIPRRYGNII